MTIGAGIASLGIAAACAYATYTTKDSFCLWGLLIIPLLF